MLRRSSQDGQIVGTRQVEVACKLANFFLLQMFFVLVLLFPSAAVIIRLMKKRRRKKKENTLDESEKNNAVYEEHIYFPANQQTYPNSLRPICLKPNLKLLLFFSSFFFYYQHNSTAKTWYVPVVSYNNDYLQLTSQNGHTYTQNLVAILSQLMAHQHYLHTTFQSHPCSIHHLITKARWVPCLAGFPQKCVVNEWLVHHFHPCLSVLRKKYTNNTLFANFIHFCIKLYTYTTKLLPKFLVQIVLKKLYTYKTKILPKSLAFFVQLSLG